MRKKTVTARANRELHAIRVYTLKNFGAEQAAKYIRELRLKMEQLRHQPNIGTDRSEEFGLNMHSCFVGSHTVFYTFDDENITIMTIMHQSSLPQKHIPYRPDDKK
ncbi:type II toxin-antitoxin system RelE/ParE family toxin [Synergistaceae bacterium OttesenSCG-928-I11]|nr:type II toxin-antitoxin system RelE/ParE family toxin [Synergistaceae bacterium OttesenSCG-928-I11]